MSKVPDEITSLAFQYVLGTLDSQQRDDFEHQLRRDHLLADEVLFWENQLEMQAQESTILEPDPNSLNIIKRRIVQKRNKAHITSEKISPFFDFLFSWRAACASMFAALVLIVGLNILPTSLPLGPNTDYVAILLDQAKQPVLTALTASEGQTLYIKWEKFERPENSSLQLWSKSRRDGVVRPLFVFNEEQEVIGLDQATLRLIQDSSHLIVTVEELGGSPYDEPSDIIVAKGVCIRFSKPSVS